MKLSRQEVTEISQKILERFISENVINIKSNKDEVLKKIIEFFTEELMVETRLNEEVRKIMEQYRREIETGKVDAQKLFEMIKKQLIKERGLIL